jgi:hypothetical protein
MLTVKVKLIDGSVDIFTTEKYLISTKEDLHPAILDVKVYAEGKRIARRRRHFHWYYKRFVYKPVQQELTPESAEAAPAAPEAHA